MRTAANNLKTFQRVQGIALLLKHKKRNIKIEFSK